MHGPRVGAGLGRAASSPQAPSSALGLGWVDSQSVEPGAGGQVEANITDTARPPGVSAGLVLTLR